MRFFTKLLVDNLLIVSGVCFNWFLCWFLNLLVQGMCFALSSFYGFTVNSLPDEALKSPVNRNWNVVYTLSLFDHRNYFSNKAVRNHFRTSGLSAICIALNPDWWVLLCRCLHYPGFTLKNFINSDAFYDFATVNGKPFAVATRQFFSFHTGQTSIPF